MPPLGKDEARLRRRDHTLTMTVVTPQLMSALTYPDENRELAGSLPICI